MKTAFAVLAEGFEEVEALTPIDYLRRAGIDAKTASLSGEAWVTGARGIRVAADLAFSSLPESFDCLILPGGMPGTRNLAAHAGLIALIRSRIAAGGLVGAICAAPALVLGKAAGVLAGRRFTCYPGMETEAGREAVFSAGRVVRDGDIITSRAAGTAGEFSIALVEALAGKSKAQELAKALLLDGAS
jgi:4-methyl-5(b-hydroxyethyl)-thiazole monophosphate biosynthesis